MRARKISVLALTAVAAGLALTGCDGAGADSASPSVGSPPATAQAPSGTSSQGSATGSASATGKKEGVSCTDQIDYTGDPRSNAAINSIGAQTGHCPAPEKGDKPSGTPKKAGVSCTNQINYADDSRSNAEINTIGEETGYCPPIQK
ncbi:hypothetical protein ACFV3R_22820 [Streptomyces sp. NPDC059740]|uniref:hypothetical protein n=1 Tax=Streptomyces sp. NPDC059740 TaxID=3346926 RepID=UPI00364D2477